MRTFPKTLTGSVAPDDVARFSACADEWWDLDGAFRMLHRITPLRLAYIAQQNETRRKSLAAMRVLDIGCGGGLMAEALARRGAQVVGIDADARAISIARAHAKTQGLSLDYRTTTIEDLARTQEKPFDLVLGLEILEHVANLPLFMEALSSLVAQNGLFIAATLNRTRMSFLLAIVLAESVLKWIPPKTHAWEKFVRPSELARLCEAYGLVPKDITGMAYAPLRRSFELRKNATNVNYFFAAQKKA